MACEEFEHRIVEYVEIAVEAGELQAIEGHLAGCADCQEFARQLRRVDVALTRGVKAPILGADFSAKLRERIQTKGEVVSEQWRENRKLELEKEFEGKLAGLRRSSFGFNGLLRSLQFPALVALGGCLVLNMVPGLTNAVTAPGSNSTNPNMGLLLTAAALFLIVGLGTAFQRQLRF
ncbi:MAG: hypothetical protein JWR26_244 [Pedosphaera sp.]|nr:hypothetical protein [Pedosphaera sp.]